MYEDLERLNALREKGAITEEEYIREKKRILDATSTRDTSQPNFSPKRAFWGLSENGYCTLLHLSQFAGVLIPLAGFVLPVIMWVAAKEDSEMADRQGRAVINWMISLLIYLAIAGILTLLVIGIPLLVVLGILNLIFVIKGAIMANEGRYWDYPMTLKFF